MAEWQRVVHTTMRKFFRAAEVNIFRNRKYLALLMNKGRVTYNHSGERMDWKVRFKQNTLQGYADMGNVTHARLNRHLTAELPWRGYVMSESVSKKERLMNKGTEAIIKIFESKATEMMDDAKDGFCPELFVDGNASGNETKIHGMESYLGDSGSTSSAQPIAVSSDTFAGLSTVLASAGGGVWNGDWPSGSGESAHDFWTPLLIDTQSGNTATAGWQATTKTWPYTCVEAIRYGIHYTGKNRGLEEEPDVVLLDTDMYVQYLNHEDTKQRINVNRGEDSRLVKMGFHDVMNLVGVDITSDFDVPANTGYGINIDKQEIRSLQSQLFDPEEPDWDVSNMSWRLQLSMFLNMVHNPRADFKLYPYTT